MANLTTLQGLAAKVEERHKTVHVAFVNAVHRSIVDGSPVTGSPGQPVDTGNLRASWIESFPEQWVGQSATSVAYARPIEAGVGRGGAMQLRSQVGGFHSVKLTVAGARRLLEDVVRRVVPDR